MKVVLSILLLLSVSFSAPAANPKIAKLVAELEKDIMWASGGFTPLHLARSASITQFVARSVDTFGFDAGHIKRYKILAIEKVPQLDEPGVGKLTAVLIASDMGDKVIFMRYEGGWVGWWTKMFDAK
jgi:hypothetical protein